MDNKQKEYLRGYNLKRYYKLKEKGICVTCQKNPSEKGKTQCGECRDKARVRSRFVFSASNKELYFQLFQIQEGKCKICSSDLVRPVLDHCHKSGELRGLLCSSCNSGIGFFKDNVESLLAAASYVQYSRVTLPLVIQEDHIETPQKTIRKGKSETIEITKTGFVITD